jgi:MOSC domain-containing protein YiiM
MTGRLLSVNVGRPREVQWQGRPVLTSIWKSPVNGPVIVRTLNLDGDQQSDLTVHGGEKKAIYVYPSEHYERWRDELPGVELPWGAFGENLTTTGLSEKTTHVGDRFRIGSAEFVVTVPRMPCYKFGIRFDRPDVIARMLENGRSGFYLRVVKEGSITAGDAIAVMSREQDALTIADAFRARIEQD